MKQKLTDLISKEIQKKQNGGSVQVKTERECTLVKINGIGTLEVSLNQKKELNRLKTYQVLGKEVYVYGIDIEDKSQISLPNKITYKRETLSTYMQRRKKSSPYFF